MKNLTHLKMKYFIKKSILPSLMLCFTVILIACSDSEGPTVNNSAGNPLAGAYILYGAPAFTDYAFYDAARDSVTDNVYRTYNPGKTLQGNPGDMKLNSDGKIYITSSGVPGSNGTIYKIDPITNGIEDSLYFGIAPNGFAINNNRIVVGNSGSTNITVLDMDFNIIKDTVEVGSNPANVLYAFNKYIVTRSALNNEPSAAFVNETNYGVTKQFFPAVPVSAIYNVNGIFISTNNNKNIYRVDPELLATTDSFAVPTALVGINVLEFKTQNSFYSVVGGNEVWLAAANSGTFSFNKIYTAASAENIQTIAYESSTNELYLGLWHSNGFLVIIDGTSGVVKRTKPLVPGLVAQKIVFRYF
ncbi:MAG: hypothetical protein IAE90_01965 [Ignavibacteria bacterium]|nr:hypothetical protein [Ignavibacteria bacterium]